MTRRPRPPWRPPPGSEADVLRSARLRHREAWRALSHGFGEGTVERLCLRTVEIQDVALSTEVALVPVSALAGTIQPRAYDDRTKQYLGEVRPVLRVRERAPEDVAAAVHLHVDRRRRLRLSAMPLPPGTGEGWVGTVDRGDVDALEAWLRARKA